MKRAWRTSWKSVSSIVAAETRGQAVQRTLGSITDAGYRARWTEIRARRAPEHDAWAAVDESGWCWDENFLPCPQPEAAPPPEPLAGQTEALPGEVADCTSKGVF